MESRIALVGILVEDNRWVERMNDILHQYGQYIVGRMGIPYREKGVHVISIVIDAPSDVINSMTGKLGQLDGLSVKALYQKGFSDKANSQN